LADAVRRNDGSAAERYQRRIRSLTQEHFVTNLTLSETLEQLLRVSDRWLETPVAERYEREGHVLELIERARERL
jgi:hypothetical protein